MLCASDAFFHLEISTFCAFHFCRDRFSVATWLHVEPVIYSGDLMCERWMFYLLIFWFIHDFFFLSFGSQLLRLFTCSIEESEQKMWATGIYSIKMPKHELAQHTSIFFKCNKKRKSNGNCVNWGKCRSLFFLRFHRLLSTIFHTLAFRQHIPLNSIFFPRRNRFTFDFKAENTATQ